MIRWILAWLLMMSIAFGAIPEQWFADKAALGEATREECYARLPKRHEVIALFPEAYMNAFKQRPRSTNIYAGEAYFIDHCLNHHPDVKDDIYRQIETILASPDEVIQDRRKGRDGILFVKQIDGMHYVLALRRYPSGDVLYKTLYPATPPIFPKLPRISSSS